MQTCVVYLLRNSFRYAARQDWDKIAKALKPVYTAATEDAATERFLEFAETWGRKYFVPFLAFDVEIRKVICSTNAIESVNARIRKAVRARGHQPNSTPPGEPPPFPIRTTPQRLPSRKCPRTRRDATRQGRT